MPDFLSFLRFQRTNPTNEIHWNNLSYQSFLLFVCYPIFLLESVKNQRSSGRENICSSVLLSALNFSFLQIHSGIHIVNLYSGLVSQLPLLSHISIKRLHFLLTRNLHRLNLQCHQKIYFYAFKMFPQMLSFLGYVFPFFP